MDSPPLPGTYVQYPPYPPYPGYGPPPANDSNFLGTPLTINGRVYSKHHEHWYEDGNFGFLVESVAFRLHGSILSRRSQVMEDLLSLPQPTSDNPSNNDDNIVVDGVPFIKLHDKANDFTNVLNIIYTKSLPGAPAPYMSRPDLMGIIRFAGKYLIDPMRQWAVSKLEEVYLMRAKDIQSRTRGVANLLMYQRVEEHIQTIDFARECSLPQYLSLSFYALATRDEAGHSAPEGTGQWGFYGPPPGWGPPPPTGLGQPWGFPPNSMASPSSGPQGEGVSVEQNQLSHEDRRRIDEGRLALTKTVIKEAFGQPENLGSEERCGDSDCRAGRPSMWQNPAKRWEQLLLHPLEELEARASISYWQHLCAGCAADVQNRSLLLRDDLVKQLVTFFKLEDEVGSDGDGISEPYDGPDDYGPYDPED